MKRNLQEKQVRAFVSRKPKRVELSKAECQKLCAAVGLEYHEGFEGRVIEHLITNETKDRYGDIVRAKGVDLKQFKRNPTIQFAHDYKSPPVGKSIKVWYDSEDKSIKSWGLFFDDTVDKTGRSDAVFSLIVAGGMPACSIGFMPVETYRPKTAEERDTIGLGEDGVEFRKSELLEYSPCPVGANPDALQNAMKDMSKRTMEVVRDNEEAFKHVLPEDFVARVLAKLAEGEPEPDPDPDLHGTGTLLEVSTDPVFQKQVEATEKLIATMETLAATITELKTVLEESSTPPQAASGKEPSEPASEDLYDVAREVFSPGLNV